MNNKKLIMINLLFFFMTLINANSLNIDDQSQEIAAARCYSKCLQLFIRYKNTFEANTSKSLLEQTTSSSVASSLSFVEEIAHNLMVNPLKLRLCLEDSHTECSRQCFKSCAPMPECICQQNDAGCLLACYFRKEMNKEVNQDECPSISVVEESALKIPISRCPKTCKTQVDCNVNQQCCPTETCGPICLQIEDLKPNIPKYTPTVTPSSTHSNIEFDWSDQYSKHRKNELPLVFILQTRTCLCKKMIDKFITPWQTLVMTHRLGAKLNALDNGTIYQFRFAAVTPLGTNGFGSISENLPNVISKPAPPFPPENLFEYKWQVTDGNMFKVEIKWDEPKVSTWRNYEYLLSWMIDHGVVQSEGEPMSSFTQYTKTLPGSVLQSTIDDLRPSTTYKIQIVTKTDWPGYGDLLSIPCIIYITTPSTLSAEQNPELTNTNSELKSCSCPDNKVNQADIRIRPSIFTNGDLQITIEMDKYSDYLINYYPEVCINYATEKHSQTPKREIRLYEQITEITIGDLQFNCRYSLEITSRLKSSPNITYQLCFCTPLCHKTYKTKNCPSDDISIIPSPKDVRFSLYNYETMTYKISWESINNNVLQQNNAPDIKKYRILWAPRKFEPVPLDHYNDITGLEPIFDLDRSDVRIVRSNITRLLLRNLTKEQLYIVKIQSLAISENGKLLESRPISIFLPTHGYSELYYHNSQRSLAVNLSLVIIVILFVQLMITILPLF